MKAQFQGYCKNLIRSENERLEEYKKIEKEIAAGKYSIVKRRGTNIDVPREHINNHLMTDIKFTKKKICFYSYAHNMDIGNSTNYYHQIKELMYEVAEIYDDAVGDKEYMSEQDYKRMLDCLMKHGEEVERAFKIVEYMVQAKDVGKVTKKMKKRNKKNKKGNK